MLRDVKTNCSVEWVAHLDEVGVPIKREARSIRDDMAEAKAKYKEAMQALRQRAAELEVRVRRHWTAHEIEGAKKGYTVTRDGTCYKSESTL